MLPPHRPFTNRPQRAAEERIGKSLTDARTGLVSEIKAQMPPLRCQKRMSRPREMRVLGAPIMEEEKR